LFYELFLAPHQVPRDIDRTSVTSENCSQFRCQ
jgi:hypothetical protein